MESQETIKTMPNEPGEPSGTNEKGESLDKKIQELELQVKEKESKYLYLYAEFENFKRRAAREKSEFAKFGHESLARELLHVVDNLERALAHMPPETDKTVIAGLEMV